MLTSRAQDPLSQVEVLHQCLASDKRPVGFLLGAGCPVSVQVTGEGQDDERPLIPAIAELTNIVAERLQDSEDLGQPFETVRRQLSDDGNPEPTVEEMLTHIRSLAAVAGTGEVRGLGAGVLQSLDDRICEVIHELVDKSLPTQTTPYHSFAKWVGAVSRTHPVEIFTPNYDLLLEQALEETGSPYFDGFAGVRSPFFDGSSLDDDRLPAHWSRVWKIHGSINWYQDDDGRVIRSGRTDVAPRRLIHPSHLKHQESRRMPYLAMLDRLRNFLKDPTAVLVTCGYSYGDAHINDSIVQGIQYTRTSVVFSLLFGDLSGYPDATELALRHPNLNLLAGDKGIVAAELLNWERSTAHPEVHNPEATIGWFTSTEEGAEATQRGVFRIGDFAVFASLLNDLLVGDRGPDDGTSNDP